jgi:hypothetical protein
MPTGIEAQPSKNSGDDFNGMSFVDRIPQFVKSFYEVFMLTVNRFFTGT